MHSPVAMRPITCYVYTDTISLSQPRCLLFGSLPPGTMHLKHAQSTGSRPHRTLCIPHGILIAEPEELRCIHTAYRPDHCAESMCTWRSHHHGPRLARCPVGSRLEQRAQPQVTPRPPCVASVPSDSQTPCNPPLTRKYPCTILHISALQDIRRCREGSTEK